MQFYDTDDGQRFISFPDSYCIRSSYQSVTTESALHSRKNALYCKIIHTLIIIMIDIYYCGKCTSPNLPVNNHHSR